jgi:hypothetical protein
MAYRVPSEVAETMARRTRLGWVAVSALGVITVAVVFPGARVWAISRAESRCSLVPAQSVSAPVPGHSSDRRADGSWRSDALHAAGCGAWHHMREHAHEHERRQLPTDLPTR